MSKATVDKIHYSDAENRGALIAVKAHLITGFLVFLLMMLGGAVMRAAQGALMPSVGADLFYQIMTVHGVGVVGTSAIASTGILWYFLRQYVQLSTKIFWLNFLFS